MVIVRVYYGSRGSYRVAWVFMGHVGLGLGLELVFSARCNIYISRLCYDVSVRLSVRLSVTEVHWRIIAILGFKFRSHFTAPCGRHAACGCCAARHAACGRIISRHASQC